mgnify:CR=1 FL=1
MHSRELPESANSVTRVQWLPGYAIIKAGRSRRGDAHFVLAPEEFNHEHSISKILWVD